ncbi:MAG: prepilin-type N-terminal cleavage/methylation domain-containing protein [Deltaproteobacteria bacterium]
MRNKGFTLIEMLIVLLFVSLLMPVICFTFANFQKTVNTGTERQKYYQDISNVKMIIERDFLDKNIVITAVEPGRMQVTIGSRQIEYFFQGNSILRKEDSNPADVLAEGFYEGSFERPDINLKQVVIYFKRNESAKRDTIFLSSDYSKWDYQEE